MIDNGLQSPENPQFGGWGGRYVRQATGKGFFNDTVDRVVGIDGVTYNVFFSILFCIV